MKLPFTMLLVVLGLMPLSSGAETLTVSYSGKGISNYGRIYNRYIVDCQNSEYKTLIEFDRGRRWCSKAAGEVACGKNLAEGASAACSVDTVADIKFDHGKHTQPSLLASVWQKFQKRSETGMVSGL